MALSSKDFNPELCSHLMIAPLFRDDVLREILVCPDTNLNILSVIGFMEGRHIEFKSVDRVQLQEEINRFSTHVKGDANEARPEMQTEDRSTIALVDGIISEALRIKASDIHLEPFENVMTVRYRLDGVLQERKTLSRELIPPLISRIKIMSGLDIAEKRRPQDGRIRFRFEDRTVDIRVSVLPTDFGEKAVLRLLDKATLRLDLKLLGFDQADLEIFESKIRLPNGIILITGPTGSGKTTTLYAALNQIKSPGINITTIEDPIEYNLSGINQTQIKPEINLTFGSALRSILRQDPNVIMVGEIRDRETLDNALRASLTGHLVFSTLHTNDAVSSVARLLDLGAEKFLLSTTIKLIVAQRLVRLICPHCRKTNLDQNERAAALALGLKPEELYQGSGCDRCFQIGYNGRTALYELLAIDGEISGFIMNSAGCNEILDYARSKGMKTLRESGIELIKLGKTTPSEVLRETC